MKPELEEVIKQYSRNIYYKSLPFIPCLQTWDERHYFFF